MIGAAVDIRLCELDIQHPETYPQQSVSLWIGHHRNEVADNVIDTVIKAGRERNSPYPLCGSVPNVSGQRQTKCHDFPDIEPDDPEPTILDDVETPGNVESPLDTVETSGSPRQDGVQYLVWSCLTKTPIKEMIAELQPHDRDDLRQDMAMKYWRKAVRQELRGQRISNLTKWLTQDVRQWIGERTDIAVGEPLTKQQIDDAKGDTLLLQRSASDESRLEKLEHDLQIEQSRFAAEIEAKHRAAKPKAILALKW